MHALCEVQKNNFKFHSTFLYRFFDAQIESIDNANRNFLSICLRVMSDIENMDIRNTLERQLLSRRSFRVESNRWCLDVVSFVVRLTIKFCQRFYSNQIFLLKNKIIQTSLVMRFKAVSRLERFGATFSWILQFLLEVIIKKWTLFQVIENISVLFSL